MFSIAIVGTQAVTPCHLLFQVKLQELHSTLKENNTKFQGEGVPQLPELPGKILFGRSQIHQVAEKRRGKIEEFCAVSVTGQ